MKKKLFEALLPLETDRLIIRLISTNDVDLLLKMDKQEETQKFLGGVKYRTREEGIEFLKGKVESGSITVCLKDKTPIGFGGIIIDENNNTGELGYIFDYDYTKKGYCTEACKKLLEVSFNTLGLNKVTAEVVDGNTNSIKLLEKLGFEYVNKKDDFLYYSKINM